MRSIRTQLAMWRYRILGNAISIREALREWKFRFLSKLGCELNIPIPELFLTLEVFDKDGRCTYRLHRHAHSYTRNAYNIMACQMFEVPLDDVTFGAGLLSLKNTAGTIYSSSWRQGIGDIDAGAGDDVYGILIGTDATAESFEDYTLIAQVSDGTGTGEMSHVATEAHNTTWTGGSLTFADELVRYFNNNSGAQIDVKEVGLVAGVWRYTSATGADSGDFLIARDKLASTVEVGDTAQLKVTYSTSLVYPS